LLFQPSGEKSIHYQTVIADVFFIHRADLLLTK
jgi:hypothetical protein